MMLLPWGDTRLGGELRGSQGQWGPPPVLASLCPKESGTCPFPLVQTAGPLPGSCATRCCSGGTGLTPQSMPGQLSAELKGQKL